MPKPRSRSMTGPSGPVPVNWHLPVSGEPGFYWLGGDSGKLELVQSGCDPVLSGGTLDASPWWLLRPPTLAT